MKTIKAIIVDDEQDARDVLNTLLSFSIYPIDIIAKCSSLKEAVIQIKKLKPDVVFLDIQMPEYAGYEIINFFDKIDFEIVFVTAFDQYAIKAFELSAIDYLVKPINRTRLESCLKKVDEKIGSKDSYLEYQNLLESLQNKELSKIVIPELNGSVIVELNQVICVQGDGSYSIIYLMNNEKLTVSKNLKYFENALSDCSIFFRSQKSWIINLSHVKKFNANQGDLFMEKDIVAKLSPQKLDDFILAMK